VSALLDVYRGHFRTTIATQLQYRMALIIWLIGLVLEPLIYLVVWSTVARSGGGEVGGYTPEDFAAYFIVFMVVNHATFTWIMWEYEYRIKHGALSAMLLRPIHPIHSDIADNVSYKLLTLIVLIPTAIALSLAFRPAFNFIPWAVLAFVPALILAFVVRYMLEWTLAQAAFWTTRVTAINQIYYVGVLLLAGWIAPLSLLPEPMQRLATILPFRWVLSFPVELLLGRLTPHDALVGFAAQGVWLVIAFVLLRLAWRAGVRRYSAVGA
jgi:ABC-2 type transport system permease protein